MSWRFQLVRLQLPCGILNKIQLVTHDSLAVWAGYIRAVRPNFLIGWKGLSFRLLNNLTLSDLHTLGILPLWVYLLLEFFC